MPCARDPLTRRKQTVTDTDLPSPILHYSLETDPSPIQVDTSVDLTFTVSGLSAPDDCTVSQIWIHIR